MNAAATAIASRVLRGGRLRGVRGAYDILPVETHWVASLGDVAAGLVRQGTTAARPPQS